MKLNMQYAHMQRIALYYIYMPNIKLNVSYKNDQLQNYYAVFDNTTLHYFLYIIMLYIKYLVFVLYNITQYIPLHHKSANLCGQ